MTVVEARPMALDEPSFDLAYRAYAGRLRAVAYAVLHDRDGAEDVVHAALTRVWSAGSYRPDRGALLPFLIACVRREAFDVLRGARRRRDRELRAARDVPLTVDETASIDPVEARRVRDALDALPAAQRDVIVRAYYGHRTLAEVAADSAVPIGTVKSRLAAALRALHTALATSPLSEGPR